MKTFKEVKRIIIDYCLAASISLAVAFFLWVVLSSIIFRFRHPWATETETLIHIVDAVMLKKVPYSEMRDR